MANNELTVPIPARLKNVAKGGHVAGAKDIIDDALGKEQSVINQEVNEAIEGNTEAVAAERQRAVAAEGALNTRLSDVEELAEISIDGGEAKIATGEDFHNPTAEQRAKVTTVGSIIDGADDEPTAGSDNMVKSGAVAERMKDIITSTNICSNIVEYENKIPRRADGEIIDQAGYNTSIFFIIKPNTLYAINKITYLAYYNLNKEYISRPDISGDTVTTPSNAVYARVVSNQNKNAWQLNEGSTLLDYETPSTGIYPYTDKTLSKENNPADAKIVGEVLNETKLLVRANELKDNIITRFNDDIVLYPYEDMFINAINGEINQSEGFACTDYIPYNGTNIKVRGRSGAVNIALVSFYNYNKRFISAVFGTDKNDVDVIITKDSIPVQTSYIRVTGDIEKVATREHYVSVISIESLISLQEKKVFTKFNKVDYYIHSSGSATYGGDTCCCTDYILYDGKDIIVRGYSGASSTCLLGFYDEKKSFLGYINGSDKNDVLVTISKSDIPAGTYYVRATGHATAGIPSEYNYISLLTDNVVNIIQLEHGNFNNDNGTIIKIASGDDFYNKLISPKYYQYNKDTKIIYNKDANVPTVIIFWYDKSFSFISRQYFTDYYLGVSVPENAAYYRIKIASSSIINTIPLIYTNSKSIFAIAENGAFTYEVRSVNDETVDDMNNIKNTLIDSGVVKYDRGYVMFPPNYSQDGEPCKLAIFCQGSGGLFFENLNFNPAYIPLFTYICNEGYVVMMICGITDYYYDKYFAENEHSDCLCTPIAMACYKAAYDYMRRNYNIAEQCVAWGKSFGGAVVGTLLYRHEIPIVAAGSLAPTCDVVGEILRNRPPQYKQYYAEAFGMEGTQPEFTSETSSEEKAYFKANIKKVIAYNPMYTNVFGLDVEAAITAEYQCPVASRNESDYTALRNVYTNSMKLVSVPYKIWQAPDDDQVSIWRPLLLVDIGKKANQLIEMRFLPLNTGGHNAGDFGNGYNHEGESPIKATVTPKYSATQVEIPVAYIELVAWWRRFGG